MDKKCELKKGRNCLAALLIFAIQPPNAIAASASREAQVTGLINSVTVATTADSPRLVNVNDRLPDGSTLQTAPESRAELTFPDKTIARLGANTAFTFKDGTRYLDLREGVILIQGPKGARGTRIDTGQLAATTDGATVVFENHPAIYKFLVLQGTARLSRPHHLGDSILVRAGQMVIGTPNVTVPDAVEFDVGRFAKTCRLMTDFAPLRNGNVIASEGDKQRRAKSKQTLFDTNLVIFGEGTAVSLVNEDAPAPPKEIGAKEEPPAGSMANPQIRGAIPSSAETAAQVSR